MSGEPILLSSNSGSQFVCHFDCPLQLSISAVAYLCHRERLLYVGLYASSLQESPVPRVVGGYWQRNPVSVADAERMPAEKPTWRFCPDNGGKLVFRRERGNHFGRARGMLIHQQNNLAMKALFSKPLGGYGYRLVATRKFQQQTYEADFLRRNAVEHGQFLFRERLLGPPSRNTVANGNLIWRQIAHQPKTADSPASIASAIDDQSFAIQALDCLVDIARDVDTDCAREHGDLQPTDFAVLHRRDWLQLNQRPLFRLRLRHLDPQSHVGAVPLLDINRSRFPQWKQRKIGGCNLVLSDSQKNIARLNASLEGGATGMNVLENPTASSVVFRLEKGSADGHLSRRSRPLLVIETRMTDLQFLNQLIELPFEFLVAGSSENSLLPLFGQVSPIDAIQPGIVELLLTRVHDLVEHQT